MPASSSQHLRLVVLGSGSKGNASWIGDEHAGVLVDCGLSTRQIFARLAAVGLPDVPIDAVLITHEHTDHVGSAAILARNLRKRLGRAVPFYMTAGTREGLRPAHVPDAIEIIRPGEPFHVGHLVADPFQIPHDTRDPVAWRVGSDGTWVGVITDLGRTTTLVTDKLSTLSAGVLEFNHDMDMLLGGSYPWSLKQRVRSSHGHLSNDQAADLLASVLSPRLRHVVLGHLSENNNQPHLALARAARVIADAGAHDDIVVEVASQHEPMRPIDVPVG